MLTLRAAAALLAAADSVAALAALVAPLGVTGPPRALDAARRRVIGAGSRLRDAHVAAGPGEVRALLGRVREGPPLRDQLPRLCARLQTHAPHIFWLLALADERNGSVALAAWSGDRRPPRVRSLVVDRAHVVDSDAETVCALAAAACDGDGLLHLRWTEVLGRDALGRRFYRELERGVGAIADSASRRAPEGERRELALLHASRLLFLGFLEAKGWLDGRGTFLADLFDRRMTLGGGFHARTLRPLFFGTLNTPRSRRAPAALAFGRVPFLNGGLFTPTPLERRHRDLHFADDALGALLGGLFARYRFTAREEAATWSDAAVDPEMLGRAFESLMAAEDRRDSGAFFTPQSLVARVTDLALAEGLRRAGVGEHAAAELLAGAAAPGLESALAPLDRLTLLDPACGSGAFLVHALQRISEIRAGLGDARPVSDIRRDVLTRSVFGVDRNPMAVWLCELRLWLSVVIESEITDPMAVCPLPNLDRNVRVGDALSGEAFAGATARIEPPGQPAAMRRRYARATGARKAALARGLDRAERTRALAAVDRAAAGARHARRELMAAARSPDLFGQRRGPTADDRRALAALRSRSAALCRERRRLADGGALPFSFAVHFADVAAAGGFDLVVGNPPWVRLHRVPARERAALRQRYAVFRHASWAAGAEAAHASAGFAGQADLSALFVERSADLLRPGGALALLVPAKLWCSLAGGGVRRLLQERLALLRVEDLSQAPALFDAAVYPSIVAARAPGGDGRPAPAPTAVIAVERRPDAARWAAEPGSIAFDATPGSPWLLLPPPVRAAIRRLAEAGIPFCESPVGRPLLGVKSGCNDAFVVEVVDRRGGVACVRAAGGRTGEIEAALLRPAVRGEAVRAWRVHPTPECLLWTCDERGAPLADLPPRAARWLHRYRHRLRDRSDARHARAWWALFRTEGAACDRPRVVWARLRAPPARRGAPRRRSLRSAQHLLRGAVRGPCRCAHVGGRAQFLVAAAWLNALAEPARGGYRRYLAWTVARLPLPRDWPRARRTLAPLVASACGAGGGGKPPAEREPEPDTLADAVLQAYGVSRRDLAALLDWTAS